jgi:hypothetical protein
MAERVAIEWILIVGCAVSRQNGAAHASAVEDWMSISKKIGFGLAVVVSAFIVNCSSDDGGSNNTAINCNSGMSKCSNDPMPTATDIDTCNKLLGDAKCGSLHATTLACLAQNQVCDEQNKTNEDATIAKCQAQYDKSEACFEAQDGGKIR